MMQGQGHTAIASSATSGDTTGNQIDTAHFQIAHLMRKKPRISRASHIHNKKAKTPSKEPRKRRHAHSKLKIQDLPFDILAEIASWLHPRDLLYLSYTSKYLRETLTSKHYRMLWVRARINMDNSMPDCPDSLSEPQYAALVFGHHCQACGVSRARKTDYVYGIRLCGPCYKENMIEGTEMHKQFGNKTELACILFDLLPPATENGYDPDDDSERESWARSVFLQRYYKPHIDAIAEHLLALEEDSPAWDLFIDKMKGATKRMIKFNRSMHKWILRGRSKKKRMEHRIMWDREASVTRKFVKMGYDLDDLPMEGIEWVSLVHQPRPLTPRIWKRIKSKLEEAIQRNIQEKEERTIRENIAAFRDSFKSYYKKYRQSARDTDSAESLKFWLPPFKKVMDIKGVTDRIDENSAATELSVDVVCVLLDTVHQHAVALKTELETKLLSQLLPCYAQTVDGLSITLPEVLDKSYLSRAISFFHRTGSCSTYEELLPHLDFDNIPMASPYLNPSVNLDACLTAKRALRMLGLPPDTFMANLPDSFICDCSQPVLTMPMSFSMLVSHLMDVAHWREYMTTHLNPNHDPSLVLYDDHDLDSTNPFIHIFTGQVLPVFSFNNDIKLPEFWLQYQCKECEGLVGRYKGDRWRYGSWCYTSEQVSSIFAHHVKMKHLRDACQEDFDCASL